MSFCPACGHDVGSSTFCVSCGAQQGVAGRERSEGRVRAKWLVGAWCSAGGAVLSVIGLWIASTVPGPYDENDWGQSPSAEVAFVLVPVGFLALLIGFFVCAALLIVDAFKLRRCSEDERASRMKEIAWNGVGVATP